MIAWRSITFRLTAWYSLMLFVGYAIFGAALWLTVQSALRAGVDDLLKQRLDRLVLVVTTESDGPADVEDNMVDLLMASPEGHLAQVRDARQRQVLPAAEKGPAPIAWASGEAAPGVRTTLIGQRAYRVLVRDVSLLGPSYRILLASSLEGQEVVRERLALSFFIAAPLALLLCALGGWHIAQRALRPLDAIADAAKDVTSSRLSRRLVVPDTGDVLERLSRTFNEMLQRLETSFARVEQFSADASHELRTPVSVIRTTAELALKHGKSEEGFRTDLKEIHAESQRLGSLIEVLLTLARQDAGAEAVQMSEIDLVALVAAVCGHFQLEAESKGLALSVVARPGPRLLIGNEPSLRQLIACLLENALAHTHTGGITVTVSDRGDPLQVSVTDTGEGIPADALERVFDRFYRVDSSRARGAGHFGLGLSIARRIAELHGAALTVESRLGEGARFTARFPPPEQR